MKWPNFVVILVHPLSWTLPQLFQSFPSSCSAVSQINGTGSSFRPLSINVHFLAFYYEFLYDYINNRKQGDDQMKLGYIRVSRDKQTTALQEDAMRQEQCARSRWIAPKNSTRPGRIASPRLWPSLASRVGLHSINMSSAQRSSNNADHCPVELVY